MAEVVKMPKMSDTMTEGVLAKWHKKVGDAVKSGDVLAEVETDKATMDFESFQDGTLLYIGIDEGASVPVDTVIAVIGKEGEDYQAALDADGGSAPAAEADKKEEKPAAAKEEKPTAEAKPTEDKKPAATAAKVDTSNIPAT
ncbi:MAG: pyruvate dehydrogenase, partial [Sphingobacteriales bacterium]